MNIKVIAFDFGGVLGTEADAWSSTFERVLGSAGLTHEEMDKIWEKHWPKLKIGKEDISEYWKDAAKKQNIDFKKVQYLYNNSITINQGMLDLVKSLKGKYKLVILSNDSIDWMDAKIKRFKLLDIFYKVYCSGNIGIAKPDVEIFKYVLKDLEIKPEELLFVDNQENNIEAANALGINSILFKNQKDLEENLKVFFQS